MARILIVGAGGGLGRAWAARLAQPETTLEPAFPGPLEVSTLTHAELDVSRRDRVEAAFERIRPDLVLNCAGKTQIDACEQAPWEPFLVHRDGAEHVARLCAASGAMPVSFSTDLVFDGGRTIPYTEEDPPNPLSVYADSKLAGELMTMKHARRHLIVRTGWLYGHPGRHFLHVFQEGVAPGEVLFGYDDQMAQATWTPDFLDAVLHLLRTGREGRYHVAAAGRVTQYGAMKRLAELLGLDADVRPIHRTSSGRQALRPRFSVLDTTRMMEAGAILRSWDEHLRTFADAIRGSARKDRDTRIATR